MKMRTSYGLLVVIVVLAIVIIAVIFSFITFETRSSSLS